MPKVAVDALEPKMAVIAKVSRDNLISVLFSLAYKGCCENTVEK
jgi:hypothetical protein